MRCGSTGEGNSIVIPRYTGGPIISGALSDCDAPVCSNLDFGLRVINRVYGSKVLTWDLGRSPIIRKFNGSLEVKVQFGRTSAPDTDNWTDLTAYAEDTGGYTDDAQRIYSMEDNLFYRVVVRLESGQVIASSCVRAQDTLPTRQIPVFNEIIRRWKLRAVNREIRPGFLLKRRRWGARCTECLDRDSGQKLESDCPTCYDTHFLGGFFQPIGCCFAQFGSYTYDENFSDQFGYAVDGYQTQLTMLNLPNIYPGDVWVDYDSDHRWGIDAVNVKTRIGTVETIVAASAYRLSSTDIVYSFPVERI